MVVALLDNTAFLRARAQILQEREAEKDEPSQSSTISSTIADDRRPKSSTNYCLYSSHARQIAADVTELRDLVLDKRKEYILCSNAFSLYGAQKFMSDEDRKKFDRETDFAFKQCTKLIKDLETQLNSDPQLRREDEFKHLITVVSLLNIYLKEVLSIVAQLRKIQVRKSRQIRKICRLASLVELYGVRMANAQKEEQEQEAKLERMRAELRENERRQRTILEETEEEDKENEGRRGKARRSGTEEQHPVDGWDDAELPDEILDQKEEEEQPEMIEKEDFVSGHNETGEDGWADASLDMDALAELERKPKPKMASKKKPPARRGQPMEIDFMDASADMPTTTAHHEPMTKDQQAQLLEENRKLFDRFNETDSELERLESQMCEIQRLHNMFAEKVSEQEQDIDIIHSRTVYTLDNLETANDFIREAIKNQANRRVILIFCLLVLTFTLLFLDWYNS